MKIDVCPTIERLDPNLLPGRNAAVIDVLRATSTIVTALSNGAKIIYPVLSVQEAREVSRQWEAGSFLLGGERKSSCLPGFDLGNSPLAYQAEKIRGKRLVITTTNGTKAIRSCDRASRTWALAFLNLSAVAVSAAEDGRDLTIVCSGTDGVFDLPDFACAGGLISRLRNMAGLSLQLNDLGLAAQEIYEARKDDIDLLFKQSFHGRRLIDLGYGSCLNWCSRQDEFSIVPVYDATTHSLA